MCVKTNFMFSCNISYTRSLKGSPWGNRLNALYQLLHTFKTGTRQQLSAPRITVVICSGKILQELKVGKKSLASAQWSTVSNFSHACISLYISLGLFLPLWLCPHCCILLYLPYFHIRMGSLLAWRCSSPKRPSFTQTPNHLFSMMSSSTKLPTMENLLLPAMPTPLLIQCPNRPKRRRHPSRPSHPNTPRNNHPVIVNPCLGGTPHLAFTLHQVATHHPADTLPLGTIPPPPATHPPAIRPPNTNACPRPPPPHLSCAGPEVDHKLPSQSVRRLEESAREDTSVHPPPHPTSPSCLPHRPGWSAARSAPGPCRHSPDPVSTQPGIHTLKCTNICHNLIYPAISALNQSLVISR